MKTVLYRKHEISPRYRSVGNKIFHNDMFDNEFDSCQIILDIILTENMKVTYFLFDIYWGI